MRVFVTGASGWVGGSVTRQLVERGHSVVGLVRSDAGAERVKAVGGAPLRGDLNDLDGLKAGARDADAVVHCGFIHDFSNFMASIETDRRAIEVLGEVLAGSNRPLLVTAGLGLVRKGPLGTEEDEPDLVHIPRLSEPAALALVDRGVRAGVVRLAPTVHGRGDFGFVASLVKIAREKGVAAYVGEGANRWAAVHRDDAARIYVLALEQGKAGERYHGVAEEGVPFRQIAETIGRKLGVPVKSVRPEEAGDALGWMGRFAQLDAPASSMLTRQRLGWTPVGPTLAEDLESGTYFD